jgi:Na+/proline symporter
MAEIPLLQKPWIVAAAAAYLGVVLAIGAWAATRTRSERDFFIAGQGIGLFVTALATMSAAFSGFVFLGGPGLTYRLGVASLWIVLPVSFTSGLLCWVLGRRLRLLAGVREVYTVPDAIACRFGSRPAAGAAAVAVALGTVAYLGAQLLALGVLLQAIFGVRSLALAMTIGLVALLAYAVVGGMLAGAYTDVAQGAVMLGAGIAVFARALDVTGGWGALTRAIAESESFGPSFLEPLGGIGAHAAFGFLFVFGVGVLGQPHMVHKFYMLDDVRKLKWMPLVLGGSQVVCLLIWVGIGLAVPALVARGALPPLDRPDDAAPAFLIHHAPDVLAGLVLAGALAAIMSTADSFMNIGSAALVRDLPRALGRPVRRQLVRGRAAVVGISIVAGLFAYAWGDLIALLGTFAFGTFAAALAPALAVGLCWERVTGAAATASIATGLGLNVGLEFLAKQQVADWLPRPPLAPGALPSAVALAASFAVLIVVSWCTRPREIDGAVRQAMRG